MCSLYPEESSNSYHAVGVPSKFEDGELVQSTVVASNTPGGTVYLEQQGVTLTELPDGAVQAIPTGTAFEGATGETWNFLESKNRL